MRNQSELIEFLYRLEDLVSRDEVPETKYEFVWAEPKFYDGALVINWGVKDFGFGQFTFAISKEGIRMDTECMSPDFVYSLLRHCRKQLIDKLEIL
jgi:hypothetical protein